MGIKEIWKAIKDFFDINKMKEGYLQGQLEGQQMTLDVQDKVNKVYDKVFNKKNRR